MKYQNLTTILLLYFVLSASQLVAQETKPEILYIPENWKFEHMAFPLGFAPGIDFEGFEELIFSPGMFDTETPDYFSYIFVMSVSKKKEISRSNLEEVLLAYYRGLSHAVAGSKEITIDTAAITCSVIKGKDDFRDSEHYSAKINFIDSFTDSHTIKLNMEMDVHYDKISQRLYILAIVSPAAKHNPVWETLYNHRREIIKRNLQLQ